MDPVAVEIRNKELIVIVYDPKKPFFIPRGAGDAVVVVGATGYHCETPCVDFKLALRGEEYIVVVMKLLGSQELG